ncbi:hypothetical protein [Flavobacterium sp.]|uniref:hypothetical protein n=1 Tax=Flavobacterium sp. TaxID=239 RepID=UPI00286F5D77|nr:hypothetical protein [Flavobacterium sp.]
MKFLNKIQVIFILLISIISWNSYSQDEHPKKPPINTEILLSNRGMTLQMIINKNFQTIPKLGFFSVTNLVGEWNTNQVNDYMTQASLTFEIAKGFKLSSGFHLTPVTGIRPSAGLIYSFANQNWLVVSNPRVDLAKDVNVEELLLVEYKPKINDKLHFYSRIQCLYGYNTSSHEHSRSYVNTRAGITYREFSFGAGTNIDYYGPMKHNENSFGGFVSFLLF